jgi:hypothetical protein
MRRDFPGPRRYHVADVSHVKEDEVRLRKALVLGLGLVLLISALACVAAGCGGDDQEKAKADLRAALDKVETEMNQLQTTFTTGGTIAQLKAAKDQMGVDWKAVIDAAKKVKGTDTAAAEKAWTDVDTAVNAVPDDATVIQAATSILGPVQTLMKVEKDLRTVAGESK